ncbi:RNA polymerase sigma-70 factor [Actinocorallia longicatena]|uniref:RNA polymerase sigma factor SigJ n=1 Tax=Actinocorallia longicatena TaxID=111803 RepID=A0ABP6QHT3_9ACTN
MAIGVEDVGVFEGVRGRLEAIAYRMLGSAVEAEDVVQEAFLRWEGADRRAIEVPEAWLTKVLTRLCLNVLGSARVRRESYVGQWLPEPVLDGDRMLGPAETAEQRESVSMAMLLVMERLTPQERAVYVLREAFGYAHSEIAEMLDLTEANCQQILRRARQHAATGRIRREVDAATARRIVEEFLAAALSGDTAPLLALLTSDTVSRGDGGGVVPAVTVPMAGALRVARFLRGLFRPNEHMWELIGGRASLYPAIANGDPALVVVVGERVAGVLALDVSADGVSAITIQVNPAKLGRATRHWTASDHGKPLSTGW